MYQPQRAPYNPFLMPACPMYQPSFGYNAPKATPPMAFAPQAFFAGFEANFNDQWWYPNSGASHHVTLDASNLFDTISLHGSELVFMGNDQGLSINSVGSMFFPLPNYPNMSLTLQNLLLVPYITKNLMSVSKFTQDNNAFFEFHPKFRVVKSQTSSEVLLRGLVGDDGLYKFPNPATQVSKSTPSLNTCFAQSSSMNNCSTTCTSLVLL